MNWGNSKLIISNIAEKNICTNFHEICWIGRVAQGTTSNMSGWVGVGAVSRLARMFYGPQIRRGGGVRSLWASFSSCLSV